MRVNSEMAHMCTTGLWDNLEVGQLELYLTVNQVVAKAA